jgi:hypothetical protein
MVKKFLNVVILLILILPAGVGCSNSPDNPASPPVLPEDKINTVSGTHHVWGIWNFDLDISGLIATAIPARSLEAHFNVTGWLLPPDCDDCATVSVNSFDPGTRILDVDVTLRNPSQLDAYDVRGIIYTDDYGHELRNDDGWTKLFDIPAGGLINPFKAFAKDVDNRKFEADTTHTENLRIYIPDPPHWNEITFAVTASWPGNCNEPYEITNFWQETITADVGSTGNIYIDVRDWQMDVNKVTLVAPAITGEDFTQFTYLSSETWSLQLTNNTGAGGGHYRVRIIANSSNSGDVALYDYVEITILEDGVPVCPVDVTPEALNFRSEEFAFEGNYLFIATESFGLCVYDISDPSNPVHVTTVPTEGWVKDIAIENGYAYLPAEGPSDYPEPYEFSEFYIIDIDPPESAYLMNTVEIEGLAGTDIAVKDGYVYLAGNLQGIEIYDVDPPETAHIVNHVETDEHLWMIEIEGDYAYAANRYYDMDSSLTIMDITSPESAHIVNAVDLGGEAQVLSTSEGYAYVYSYDGSVERFHIVDVDPPETASVVKTIDSITIYQVAVEGNYAYASAGYEGMHVIDISNPASPALINTVDVDGYAYPVSVHNGYAYVADFMQGFHVIDIDPPESAHVIKTVHSLTYPEDVSLDGDYAFVADYRTLKVLDVSTPESADIMNTAEVGYYLDCVDVADGFAYMGASYGYNAHFYIVDIDPVESTHTVASIENIPYIYDIAIYGKYAYVAAGCLYLIDIDPPESTYIIKKVYMPYLPYSTSSAKSVEIYAGHAYVAAYEGGLQVVDIYSPMEAHLAHNVDTPGIATGIAVADGYAYVGDGEYGLQIIDIDPLLSSYIMNTVDTPGNANEVVVANGYAYVADGDSGLQIIDVDPPQSAHIVSHIDPMDAVTRVDVSDGHAYIVGDEGLRIIKLW